MVKLGRKATGSIGAVVRNPDDPVWAGVVSLALGVFALVSAEFLPAAVLTPMAADLRVSVGAAGQAVTATAVVGAFAALFGPIVTRGLDRRTVLWLLIALLCVSDLLTAFAADLPTMLAARVLLGVALGGFWSMAAAVAMRLVSLERLPRAMAIVFTGVSLATVLAAPLGAYIGDLWGWRATFLLAGAVGVLSLAGVTFTIPRLPPTGAAELGHLVEVGRRPSILIALAAVVLVVSGHFAGFTYIRPVLEQVTRLDAPSISLVFLVFGLAGFAGNLIGGRLASRDPKLAVLCGAALLAASALVLSLSAASPWIAGIAFAFWGLAFTMLPIGFQSWVTTEAVDHAELAGGLLTATFQVAIATGAIGGGVLVDRLGPVAAPAYCAAAAAAGLALVGWRRAIIRRRADACACAAG